MKRKPTKAFGTAWMLVFMMMSGGFAGEVKIQIEPEKLTEIPNAIQLQPGLVAGGVPSARGLGQAAEQGIRTVIDLRNPEEGTAEEADYANAVGLNYINIPVSAANFSRAQADKLAEVLKNPVTGPAFLHCATGQRAVAVWTLYRNLHEGVPSAQAFEEAKAKGLQKPELEVKLRELLK